MASEASPRRSMQPTASLAEVLDRVLETGVVAAGEVVLSVADVDLVYLNLRALLASVQSLLDGGGVEPPGLPGDRSPDHPPRPPDRPGPGSGPPPPGVRLRPVVAARSPRPVQRTPRSSALTRPDPIERLARRFPAGARGPTRITLDPEAVERGLAGLVLTVIDLLRELMERQAIRRMESGSLTEEQVERLGRTFMALEDRLDQLKETFGLDDQDLGLPFRSLGDGW